MSEEENLESCLDIRFAALSVSTLDNQQEKDMLFPPTKDRKVLDNMNVS
jgi:hypothetical protein